MTSPLFKSLKLTNFLSFGSEPAELEFQPLNILVGINGKSNTIESFELPRDTPNDFFHNLKSTEGAGEWFWKDSTQPSPPSRALTACVELTMPENALAPLVCNSPSMRYYMQLSSKNLLSVVIEQGRPQLRIVIVD